MLQIVNLTPDQATSFGEILIQGGEDRQNVRVAIDTDGFKVAVGSGTWTAGRGVVGTRTVAPDHNDIRAEAWQEGYDLGLEDGLNDSSDRARNPYFRYCAAPTKCSIQAEPGRQLCTTHRTQYEALLTPAPTTAPLDN